MKRIGLALALLLVGGCATPYRDEGYLGGFSERQLSHDPPIFRVRFAGNRYTSRSRAWDFSMLRAAELVVKHGYMRFVIDDENSSVKKQTTARMTVYGDSANTTFSTAYKPGQVLTVTGVRKGGVDACLIVREMTRSYKIKSTELSSTTVKRCG